MSGSNSTNGRTERAAALYRNSDDKQENSIARQQATVPPYAEKHDYQIVETYVFDGIPGDKIGKHPRWRRLLQDAGKLWTTLLMDEPSRLSREDPDYFVRDVKLPLKEAGVRAVSVANGPMDWESIAGDIITLVNAHQSRDEVRRLSRRVLTEMARLARNRRILGPAPYGYLTEYETIHEPGKPPVVRPKRFIIDPRKGHIVTWIFERYAEGGWAMDDIARELNARAVEPPARKGGRPSKTRQRGEPCNHWTHNSVRAILENPRYTGALTWNRRSRGKYHKLTSGAVEAKAKADDVANSREEWMVSAEPAHEPLVSQELFDRAQARRSANKGGKPSLGAYLFSGLLTCSHCGRTLTGITHKGKRRYRCHMYDDTGVVVCGYNAVGEDWLLDRVLRVIEEEVLAPERLQALRDEVRRQDEEEAAPGAVEPMRIRLAELKGKIAQGNENLALLPSDRVPGVVAVVRAWEQERDRIEAELKRREGGGNLGGLDEAIAECEALLWRLREAVEGGDALLLREVVREAVARIELTWERHPYGKRTRYVVSGGVIHLRPQTESSAVRFPGSRAEGRPAGRNPPRRSAAECR
jgi:DNA invertase Pin-like site-specific DNA recombinase